MTKKTVTAPRLSAKRPSVSRSQQVSARTSPRSTQTSSVQISVPRKAQSSAHQTVWQQLNDSNNPLAVDFMKKFDEYNSTIGYSLGMLSEQPQDIKGRETELEQTISVIERRKTPIAILIGKAGVGKTAICEELMKRVNTNSLDVGFPRQYMIIALRLGKMGALGNNKLVSALANLIPTIKKMEKEAQEVLGRPELRFVLFIDEVHLMVTIFGSGTKVGGDTMKDILARSDIAVISATTRREYDSTIAVDKPFAERFKQIEIEEVSDDVVMDIAKDWWQKVAVQAPALDESVIRKVIDINKQARSASAEPRKSLDILEDLEVLSRRNNNRPVTEQDVSDVFRRRFRVSLDFSVDADDVYAEIDRRIKGQFFAKEVMRKMLRSLVFNLDPISTRPRMRVLMSGPTGVGKSEMVKAISDAIYPGERPILFLNMPDFKTIEHSSTLRKTIGEFARHTPNGIILMDELEKGHQACLDDLLYIMDEGKVNFDTTTREGFTEIEEVSLKNMLIFATTNAGHEIFDNDANFSQRNLMGESGASLNAEIEQLQKSLQPFLIKAGFRPEMLGRFDRIIPFRGLSEDTILEITEIKLNELFDKFERMYGYDIQMEKPHQFDPNNYNYVTTDVALYITFIRAKANDPKSGGARSVMREIDTTVKDAIIDAIVDNPDSRKFKIYVTKDSAIFDSGVMGTEGGIKVEPIND